MASLPTPLALSTPPMAPARGERSTVHTANMDDALGHKSGPNHLGFGCKSVVATVLRAVIAAGRRCPSRPTQAPASTLSAFLSAFFCMGLVC